MRAICFFWLAIFGHFAFGQCNPDIESDLLARWDLNGNTFDSSGNGHHGNNSFAKLATDRCNYSGGCFSFFGSGQYITVPDSPALRLGNTDFTISAWVFKWDTITNSNYSIIAKRVFSGQQGFHFFVEGGSLKTGFAVSGNDDPTCYGTQPIIPGNWHHLSVTYTKADSCVRFYLDGFLNGVSYHMPPPNPNSGSVLRIGNDTWLAGTYGFNGKIDDIRLYKRALDSCSIESLIVDGNPCSLTSVSPKTRGTPTNLLYPNPATHSLVLKGMSCRKIVIRTVDGRVAGTLHGNQEWQIDWLAPGMYFAEIETLEKQIHRQSFIKN